MSPPEESDPFATTSDHYAEHRPQYCDAAVRYLVNRFDLDGSARVLDLGCGPGHVAVALAPHVREVVGLDPSGEMLRQARTRAAAAGVENVEWVLGSDADLDDFGPVRLMTVGRAFHRVDQQRTLDWAARATEPGGGVAILDGPEWLTRGTADWQDEVYAVADRFLDDLPPRTGPVEYEESWADVVAASGFDVEVATFEFEREWDVDGVVGYVFSLSYCSPKTFGDDRAAFEAALRDRLDGLGGGPFVQHVEQQVVAGRT